MGGDVLFALVVAGFPRDLPKTIIREVFRGGADKVAEAGGVIAGGHTVIAGSRGFPAPEISPRPATGAPA